MTTINYFDMFHDATREHAQAAATTASMSSMFSATIGPMRRAVELDAARHSRAPMYDGSGVQWVVVECACGVSIEVARRDLHDAASWCSDWCVERCDGSSCGIENCGRMVAKCGRCRS